MVCEGCKRHMRCDKECHMIQLEKDFFKLKNRGKIIIIFKCRQKIAE